MVRVLIAPRGEQTQPSRCYVTHARDTYAATDGYQILTFITAISFEIEKRGEGGTVQTRRFFVARLSLPLSTRAQLINAKPPFLVRGRGARRYIRAQLR